MEMDINRLKNKVDSIFANTNTTNEKLKAICDVLESEISYYDWVGFYFKNGDKDELKLGQSFQFEEKF